MWTKYDATRKVSCRKMHTCNGCGCAFRYLLEREVSGRARTKKRAAADAEREVATVLQEAVDFHPCPVCGLYGPDMIAKYRFGLHLLFLVLSAVGVAIVILLALLTKSLLFHEAAWIGGGVGLLAAVLHLAVARWNPNRNLERNRKLAQERVKDAILHAVSKPPAGYSLPDSQPRPMSTLDRAAAVVGPCGSVVFSTLGLLLVLQVWPVNDDCDPPVAGPGDACCIQFPSELSSMRGYWRGSPVTSITNFKELGLLESELRSSSQEQSWPDRIVGYKGKEAEMKEFFPWVEVTVPERENLVGNTLNLRLQLVVTYPAESRASRSRNWEERQATFEHATELRVAAGGASSTYETTWWITSITGTILLLVAGVSFVISADNLRGDAHPTTVAPDVPGQTISSPPAVSRDLGLGPKAYAQGALALVLVLVPFVVAGLPLLAGWLILKVGPNINPKPVHYVCNCISVLILCCISALVLYFILVLCISVAGGDGIPLPVQIGLLVSVLVGFLWIAWRLPVGHFIRYDKMLQKKVGRSAMTEPEAG